MGGFFSGDAGGETQKMILTCLFVSDTTEETCAHCSDLSEHGVL